MELIFFIVIGALIYGIYHIIRNAIVEPKKRLNREIYNLKSQSAEKDKRIKNLENGIQLKDQIASEFQKKNTASVNLITSMYADYLLVQYDISARYLERKERPAYKEAERITELKILTKQYIEAHRQMKYKYELLLQLFPELISYIDDFESIKELENFKNLNNLQEDYDKVRDFLSKEEYESLSTDQKNQLALDRYNFGRKSNWQIGRDYEMFVGHLYENDGWNVKYFGIEKKLEDLGRDLIAKKGNTVHIIQCKYWSNQKIIHEKHITQLFGTSIAYSIDNEIDIVEPVFITNIKLSETAKKIARKLEIIVKEKIEIGNYPRIKCNVNNGNKIYHLPFDQQYDRTKIQNEDESYEFTIKEASAKGFRRAFKFHFSK